MNKGKEFGFGGRSQRVFSCLGEEGKEFLVYGWKGRMLLLLLLLLLPS